MGVEPGGVEGSRIDPLVPEGVPSTKSLKGVPSTKSLKGVPSTKSLKGVPPGAKERDQVCAGWSGHRHARLAGTVLGCGRWAN
jgi:hypothetical protein